MFSDLIKSVEEQYAKNLPFVIYRKPKEQKVRVVFQEDNQIHPINDFTETGFVFAPFDKMNSSVLIPAQKVMEATYITIVHSGLKQIIDREGRASKKEFHLNLVNKGINEIQLGAMKKVVLSHKLEVNSTAAPIHLFYNILETYDTAFCYLWHHPGVGTWLGATPEILLKTENRRLTTMSLAGTQKRVEGVEPEWGKKEIEEQQLVTDYISNALEDTVTNLKIGERKSVSAGNLWHLRTQITATFDTKDFANIIQALHPTPAVCGLPRLAAKQFILENENYNREFYTGYLGELNFKTKIDRSSNRRNQENKAYAAIKKTTTLFVNLRCMKLEDRKATIYVGGGVTADSDADKEWQETVAKCATMLRILSDD